MVMSAQEAMAQASLNAKAPNAVAQRDQARATASRKAPIARVPGDPAPATQQPGYTPGPQGTTLASPATDLAAMFAMFQQQQAQLAQLAELMAQKDAQIAELKKSGPAPKAEKPPTISAKNCTYSCDPSTGKLTIVIDLNADILDDAGKPKVSKGGTGNTTGVAQLSGSFFDKKGRKVGVSMNAYHKF